MVVAVVQILDMKYAIREIIETQGGQTDTFGRAWGWGWEWSEECTRYDSATMRGMNKSNEPMIVNTGKCMQDSF